MLFYYKNLKDVPMLLELAIWKSKMTDHLDRTAVTLTTKATIQCHAHFITMVFIVFPNGLTYLNDDLCES
jgi:hypothetical protein